MLHNVPVDDSFIERDLLLEFIRDWDLEIASKFLGEDESSRAMIWVALSGDKGNEEADLHIETLRWAQRLLICDANLLVGNLLPYLHIALEVVSDLQGLVECGTLS